MSEQEVKRIQSEVRRSQKELEPKEDLAPYTGQWVALRSGYVIASGPTFKTVSDDPEVVEGDVIIPAIDPLDGFFY